MDRDGPLAIPSSAESPASAQASPSDGHAPQQLQSRAQLGQQFASQAPAGDGSFLSQLTTNPFFTAGFGLAALGTGLTAARKGLILGAALLRRRLLVDVEITRHDESYRWFLQWMTHIQRQQQTAHGSASPSSMGHGPRPSLLNRLLARFAPGLHHLSIQTSTVKAPSGAQYTNFALVPGPGRHILRYRNAFIAVQREREKGPLDPQGKPFEAIKLTTLYAHRNIFENLFLEAHALAQQANEGKTEIYTPKTAHWEPLGHPRRKRPLSSVVLAEGVKERIVEDVRRFLDAREWYLDRGIPYRRGYLLYGPPGTGKSSFIQALAGELDFNIAMLNLSERGMTDDRLMFLLTQVPPRSLVVLEDADAAFSNRRTQTDEDGYRGANVTFSGLLNALDGVASAEERVVFLTTNHVERLDAALVRPGRVDMTVRLGEATQWQTEHLWDRFFASQDPDGELKREYVSRLTALGLADQVSTATLQGHFLFNKDDPQGALATVEQLLPHEDAARSGVGSQT
ncbi:MAG: hypothetical protein Q9159_003632 [Coniocarpon cinnabarinum]